MRGGPRNNKPAAQRELDGSEKRARHKPEPSFAVVCPEQPDAMTEAEQGYWRYYAPQMAAVRVLTLADRDALRLYCEALAQLDDLKAQQAEPEYRRIMLTVTVDGAGNEKVKAETNPLDIQRRAWTQIARLCASECGLTPVSRARVGVHEHAKPKDRFGAFQARRQALAGDAAADAATH